VAANMNIFAGWAEEIGCANRVPAAVRTGGIPRIGFPSGFYRKTIWQQRAAQQGFVSGLEGQTC